jgi:signal transduction histidine kinase/purine-cytosine permease-like protein
MHPPSTLEPTQHVIKIRRDYNAWVASETLEDYALRFTPRSARRWGAWRVANTAFGGAASFLVLEAVGATLLVQYGFVNAALAILTTGLIILVAGVPISVYAARYGVDMDLLTRGAGFGYLGSTLTSLIYAGFTFIFFALEAAVMAYALDMAFDIPPAWGYLICALVVLPLVTHGIRTLSRLQVWTQPLWLLLLITPYVFVFAHHPGVLAELAGYGGQAGLTHVDAQAFGAALTVGMALITQMGEQADYLRFMPERATLGRGRWLAATLLGGVGWVVPGVLKMLGGALLAWLALSHDVTHEVPLERAVDPNQLYLGAFEEVFSRYDLAVAATALLVLVSQLKINVTNAYAGSLAWSNFFARLTHSHPGRVVWLVFNIGIALLLMEMDLFQALGGVLGLYANIAISWFMAVVADLLINKPLGWSPKGIEFRRAHLHDLNPVGVGAMGLASALSIAAHLGAFGALAQAWSALIALLTALSVSPLIAWATQGRFYLARLPTQLSAHACGCTVCAGTFEAEDMAVCPAYGGSICSLCCTLDARCQDRCKPPEARWSVQSVRLLRWVLQRLLPRALGPYLDKGLGDYLVLMLGVLPLLGGLLSLGALKAFAALSVLAGVGVWWLVLAQQSRRVAQEEAQRQTQALQDEIARHRQTDLALQEAKRRADAANQAKSRYITTISHEMRTPLNAILGYAQLLEEDASMPAHRRHALSVIHRGGDHLLSLIEGTLDLARIESGKLSLDVRPMRFVQSLREISQLFELQAAAKGLGFRTLLEVGLPEAVRADDKRLRQILINVLGNAVKFTRQGEVVLWVGYTREMARFEIRDTGPGMTRDELARVFEPFERGAAAGAGPSEGQGTGSGTGLGLTISRMLTDLMGGELTVESTPGVGTVFRLKLFLPSVAALPAPTSTSPTSLPIFALLTDPPPALSSALCSGLQAVRSAAALGHVRGVLRLLDTLDTELGPEDRHRPLLAQLRLLARACQLNALDAAIQQALSHALPPTSSP